MSKQIQNNLAYDLSLFETAPSRKKISEVKPARKQKQNNNVQIGLSKILKFFAVGSVLVCLTVALISNGAELNELTAKIDRQKAYLKELKNESTKLQLQLNEKTSLNKVEQIATEELGLVKLDKHQIKYVDLSGDDKIVLNQQEEEKETIMDKLSLFADSIKSYLGIN